MGWGNSPPILKDIMIYLKNLNGQVKEYKDHDVKTINHLIASGKWERVTGLKDLTPYVAPKKVSKKKFK